MVTVVKLDQENTDSTPNSLQCLMCDGILLLVFMLTGLNNISSLFSIHDNDFTIAMAIIIQDIVHLLCTSYNVHGHYNNVDCDDALYVDLS